MGSKDAHRLCSPTQHPQSGVPSNTELFSPSGTPPPQSRSSGDGPPLHRRNQMGQKAISSFFQGYLLGVALWSHWGQFLERFAEVVEQVLPLCSEKAQEPEESHIIWRIILQPCLEAVRRKHQVSQGGTGTRLGLGCRQPGGGKQPGLAARPWRWGAGAGRSQLWLLVGKCFLDLLLAAAVIKIIKASLKGPCPWAWLLKCLCSTHKEIIRPHPPVNGHKKRRD